MFTDDNTGYVVGQTLAGGIILKTTDAGTTWTPYTTTESGSVSYTHLDVYKRQAVYQVRIPAQVLFLNLLDPGNQ